MARVVNATQEEINICLAGGNWFRFKPGQEKKMNDDVARFIATERKDSGLAVLPDLPENEDGDVSEEEMAQRKAEHDAAKEAAIQAALDGYLAFHRSVVYNNQVSLRMDLEQANMKVDPAKLASKGEINSMRILAKYQRAHEDKAEEQAKEFNDLARKVGIQK